MTYAEHRAQLIRHMRIYRNVARNALSFTDGGKCAVSARQSVRDRIQTIRRIDAEAMLALEYQEAA